MSRPPSQCNLDELGPQVETASRWQLHAGNFWQVRLPAHYLVLVESGGIEGVTPVCRAGPGDLLCYPPSDRVGLRFTATTIIYQMIVRLAPRRKRHEVPGLREIGPLPQRVALGGLFPEARAAFESVCLELPQPGVVHRLRTQAAVYELLALIAAATRKSADYVPALDAWERLRLRIASDPEQPINVASLAQELSISADHFARQFRQRFGMSPRRYHTDVRIREAAHRLRDPARSLKGIAYDLGFADAKSLARVIKRHLGLGVADLRRLPEQESPQRTDKLIPLNYAILAPERDWEWVQKHVLDV